MVTMKNVQLEQLELSGVLTYLHGMREGVPIKLKDHMYKYLMPRFREAVKNYMECKASILEKYAKKDADGKPIQTESGFDLDPSNPALLADIAELYDLECQLDIPEFTLKLKTVHETLANALSARDLELLSAVFKIEYC